MPAGRPRIYESPEEMQDAIDWYFFEIYHDSCGNPRTAITTPPTITGLALSLGFAARQSLIDYAGKEEYSFTIKRAKLMVEQFLEGQLLQGSPAGVIFNLKNNFGWRDQQDIVADVKSKGSMKWEVEIKDAEDSTSTED